MPHATGSFTGLKNITIFTQHWLPDSAPRAAILIVHGYAEHSGRYAHVAAHFVAHGYAVYALDHRGHGRSEGTRTQVRDFDEYVTDLRTYAGQVRAENPDLPLVFYGHSMGSLIALLYAHRWQDELAALITTGTALKLAGVNRWLHALVRLAAYTRLGVRVIPALPAVGISRDPAVVEDYINDPLVYHGRFRFDMTAALAHAAIRGRAALPGLRLPYLALHGSEDPLTLPESLEIVRAESGSPDTTVKLYDGLYHEVHNAPEKDRVLDDITDWLAGRVS